MRPELILVVISGLAFAQAPQSAAPNEVSRGCRVVSPAASSLEFDAASVKPSGPLGPNPRMGISGGPGSGDPGRVWIQRFSLTHLFATAYGVSRIVAPGWMDDYMAHGFDVIAIMPAATTREQYCGMLRNLLVERFRISFHSVSKAHTAYELVTLPGGPKFPRHATTKNSSRTADNPNTMPAPEKLTAAIFDEAGFIRLPPSQKAGEKLFLTSSGSLKLTFRGDMRSFASSISSYIGYPIVTDATGLAGLWDIHVEFSMPPHHLITGGSGLPEASAARDAEQGSAPSLFSAVERQLGLRLKKVKDVPVDIFVIDHADKVPTEN
ncbi:MAG TPA: TIGR03435 family protein [Bryobacteraceae bacterium]|nr:TIGR03435 family protein [Bryobacteraceae bacterium]